MTTKPPPNEGESVREIALERIAPSRFEPQARRRARFTDEDLKSLADSIRTRGLRQPILVRPVLSSDETISADFEIVFGERRFLAAKKAGLTRIRCFVEKLTDAEVIELQYEENHQRKENSPLDDAFLFNFLVQNENYAPERLADRFNKSLREVKQILSLTNLIPEAVEELEDGKLPLRHAVYLSSFPAAAQKEIVGDALAYNWGDIDDGPVSFKQFREEIDEHILRELKNAPFDPENPALHQSSQGLKCADCRDRSGFEPLLFSDLKGSDHCLNRACFEFKTNVHLRLQREAIAARQTVATDKPVEELAKKVPLVTERAYVQPENNPFREKPLTNQKLLDEPECESSVLSLAVDGAKKGRQVYICTNGDCPVHHPEKSVREATEADARQALEAREREFDETVRRAVREKVFAAAMAAIDDFTPVWMFDDLVQRIVFELFIAAGVDTRRFIQKVCADWKLPKDFMDLRLLREAIAGLTRERQGRLMFLLVSVKDVFINPGAEADYLKKLARDYAEIDYALLDARTRLELAPAEFREIAEKHFEALADGQDSPVPRFWLKED
ncbi:MAG: ParB/RepB/Spo0J family partition protein [Acidobacteria bacterium]|nr:ParB/RepB/Spo0J family partition protein [Acidobacteriota bacterium]